MKIDEQQVEEKMPQSRAQLASIINSTMDAIISVDESQRIVLFNPAAEEMFDCVAGDAIGQPLDRFIPNRFRAAHRQHVERFGQHGETHRKAGHLDALWALRANGQEFPIEASISRSQVEGKQLYTVILRDITERKLVEGELRQSEANLRGIFNNTLQAFVLFDRERHVLAINPIANKWISQMIGRPVQVGERADEPFSGFHLENFDNSFAHALNGETITREVKMETPHQSFWFEANFIPVTTETDGVVGVSLSILNITERRKAEEVTRASEERHRLLAEAAHDYIFIINEDFAVAYINEFAANSLGRPPEHIVGQGLTELFPKEVATGLQHSLQAVFATGEAVYAERPVPMAERGIWLGTWLSPIKNDAGKVTAVLGISRDITARKQAEEALRQSELRYRAIVEDQTELIVRFSADGTILFTNEAYSRTIGNMSESMVGQNVFSLLDGATRSTLEEKLSQLTPANSVIINEHPDILADGRVIWLRWTDLGIFDDDGHLLEVQGVGHDITERREAEEKLRQSETQLKHIIDTVPEGVLLLGADNSVRLTNPVADQFLAVLAPESEGDPLNRLGNRRLSELLTSPPRGLWHEITTGDHVFEAIARPIEISSENAGWVLVLRDVTQERVIEQRAQQQGRLAALGQMAAGIAHDFNNIMAVITLYAQLIPRMMALPPHVQDKMHTIEQQSQRATDLIQQILDFSRQSVLERHPLDLLPFMTELTRLLQRTLPEHIQIELNSTEEAYLIHADHSRIQQVIMNLAVNAGDAMPEGGHLQFSLRTVHVKDPKPLFAGELPPGEWVLIEVADSGSGIPQEVLQRIFEPFFTTKEVGRGTGLGLAQVHGIVQQHDGCIDVETREGQGTTFSLYFPILETGERNAILPATVSLPQGHGQLILLVEDDLATRQALIDSLALLNYRVIQAANGREALTILDTRANEIGLVLSDMVMPEMGGVALTHAMRQQKLPIPIILMSGHPLEKEWQASEQLDLAGLLPKPPSLIKLSRLLAKALST